MEKTQKPYTKLLDEKLAQHPFLVLAHRGLALGNIVENTIDAMRACFMAGADAVEMDVIQSTDGDFFVFHDGNEKRLFDYPHQGDIKTLSSHSIQQLSYKNSIDEDTNTHVESLESFLHALPKDKLINLDRGWDYLPALLPYLDQFDIAERLLLKTHVVKEHLTQIAAHQKKYMFFPICFTLEDVEKALAYQTAGINIVGIELIAQHATHPFLQQPFLDTLKSQQLVIVVNSLNLNSDTLLWGDYHDDISIKQSPSLGWGKIAEQGIDIINTDWPSLLVNYRNHLTA